MIGRQMQRFWGSLLNLLARTTPQRRPTIEPQAEAADCGYVCISAIMASYGRPLLLDEIKALTGTTSRGLTLRQVRDGLRACGAEADVLFFDRTRPESYPCRGILLVSSGHYIVLERRKGDRFEIYDPEFGWSWVSHRKLARRSNGLGIEVRFTASTLTPKPRKKERSLLPLTTILRGRHGRTALVTFAIGQFIALAIPLLSMWSVDQSVSGLSLGAISVVAIGFAALSLTNIAIALAGEIIQAKMKKAGAVALSRIAFDALSQKRAYWFEVNTSASIQNRVASLYMQLDFYIDVVRSMGTLIVTLLIGIVAIIFVSPWLLVPGLVSLAISIALDLAFDRSQRSQIASAVETSQRRQAFVLDALSQIPLIARFDALTPAKVKFASLVRGSAVVEASLQSLRGWRSALGSLCKSGETLIFVTLSAVFMAGGEFTIGAFVALGAYKDLLANAVGAVFQLLLRRRSLRVHELQGNALLTTDRGAPSVRTVETGDVIFSNVSFGYGSLDRPVLSRCDLHFRAGECTAIRGPSGCGKSTIAKLLVGTLAPTEGSITVDGLPLADVTRNMGAVLQSDRLIDGTIRDNILLFRRNYSDEQILDALKLAAIDDFVLGLPMRLNTRIGESCAGLSGGQRQRLLIARAVLGKPALIVLDEATCSLEVEVESKILVAMRSLGTTTILVAHRPEVWALADRVYLLNGAGGARDEGTIWYHGGLVSGSQHPVIQEPVYIR